MAGDVELEALSDRYRSLDRLAGGEVGRTLRLLAVEEEGGGIGAARERSAGGDPARAGEC